MSNNRDFSGAENSDELNRGNHGNTALASGDAGAILNPADLGAFEPGRVYQITGESPIKLTSGKKAATPWYLSRTFYVNAAALLSLLLPAVREWLKNNPVDFVTALTGVNILLRFITYGKHQISSGNDRESGSGNGTVNESKSRPLVPGENDLANSSIAGAGTSDSPVTPGSIKRRMLLTIGVLMVLLGGSCSSNLPAPTSVSLSEGQAVIVRGGSSLVIDREGRKLLWNQSVPEMVVAPPVVQGK